MTDYICTQCGYEGRRKTKKKGSTSIELLLWVVFLIPGPFYSLWRIFSKEYVCPICEDKSMVSVKSALGQRKLQILEDEISGSNSPAVVETPSKTNTEETPQPEAHTGTIPKEEDSPPQPKPTLEKKQDSRPPSTKADEW